MNKSSPKDFSIPQRQSYVAIVMIIYKYYKIILRQAWPFVLFFIFGSRGNRASWESYVLYIVLVTSLFSMGLAILNYFKHYFHIENDELHVSKGVFKKQKISIPLERVQTINFEENVFHRIFKVTSLKIDTAGSSKKEFDLEAIGLEKAKEIRDYILSKKNEIVASQEGEVPKEDNSWLQSFVDSEKEEAICNLDFVDLIKIGVSYNHFKSGGLILGGLFWLLYELEDLLPNWMPEDMQDVSFYESLITFGLIAAVFFVFAFLVISFLYSLIRSILRYYNLRFTRKEEGFKIISGLFTRQEFSALDNKIQQVGWKDNLIQKKLFGIFDFNLKQAGSIAINSKKSFVVPGINFEKIGAIIKYHFGDLDLDAFEYFSVHKKMLYRSWMYQFLFFGMLAANAIFWNKLPIVLGCIIVFLIVAFTSWKKFHKIQYGISQDVLHIKGGTFGDESVLIKLHKIQSIRLKQSPYQQRHKLATVKIYTASGNNSIPYLEYNTARDLADRLIYEVEISKKPWM